MRSIFSAAGRAARRFPRAHLALSMALVGTVTLLTLAAPESGESRPEAPATLTVPPAAPLPDNAGDRLAAGTAPAAPRYRRVTLTVAPGDTLSALLQAHGVTATEIHNLVNGDPRLRALASIRPGDTLRLSLDENGDLAALSYHPSRVKTVEATRDNGDWTVSSHTRDYQRRLRFAEGHIEDSLFLAGQQAGISDRLTMQLANIFGWDLDFVQDIRRGDHFRVLYEDLYLDGKKVGEGNILAAEFWNRDRHLSAYRFRHRDGEVEYLDADGNAMRREFIRTPVAFTRISSRFSMGRKHPILNRIRKHEGIDYAAPSGTPIKAAGKGKVVFAGRKGGYGNVIILQHGNKYSTLYAHMRGFARGIHVGERVDQGETIGYVGMTGLATGPHLHYEFRVNGVHRDPLTVPLPRARGVSAPERPRFAARSATLHAQMGLFADAATLASNRVF